MSSSLHFSFPLGDISFVLVLNCVSFDLYTADGNSPLGSRSACTVLLPTHSKPVNPLVSPGRVCVKDTYVKVRGLVFSYKGPIRGGCLLSNV